MGTTIILVLGILTLLVILGLLLRILVIEKSYSQAVQDPEHSFENDESSEAAENNADLVPLVNPEDVDLFEYFRTDDAQEEEVDTLGEEQPQTASTKHSQSKNKQPEEEGERPKDMLTKLPTGTAFLFDCRQTLKEAAERKEKYAVVSLDFNRFKLINALKGASIGDVVLTRLAKDLPDIFGDKALFTRNSADFFTILVPFSTESQFDEFANQLKLSCEKSMDFIGVRTGLNVSMGVAVTQNSVFGYSLAVLNHKADIARYSIKSSRYDSYIFFNNTMITTYLYGESALENYNEYQYEDEFALYYQPQMDITTHCIVGCQALLRWSFVDDYPWTSSIDESNGTIPNHNAKALYKVCKAMAEWKEAGAKPIVVSVRLLATDLFKTDIDILIARCLEQFDIEQQYLNILIDIDIMPINTIILAHQIEKIRELGVRVTIDNIHQTGSPLTLLHEVMVDSIQLRKEYLNDLLEDREGAESVDSNDLLGAFAFARTRGFAVVAEGVATQQQADVLSRKGCRYIQGPYCGIPMKSGDFLEFLKKSVVGNPCGDPQEETEREEDDADSEASDTPTFF